MKNLFRIQSARSESGTKITLYLSGTLLEENIPFLHVNCTELSKDHKNIEINTAEITNIDESAALYLIELDGSDIFSVTNPSLYLKTLLSQLENATFRS